MYNYLFIKTIETVIVIKRRISLRYYLEWDVNMDLITVYVYR